MSLRAPALLLAIAALPFSASARAPGESAARPIVRQRLGFNTRQLVDWALSSQDARVDQALDEMVAAGAQVHRLSVLWGDVQPEGPDRWDWSRYDRVMDAAAKRGLRVVLNPTGSPNWARKPERRVTDPGRTFRAFAYPDDHQAWRAFIRALAQRYPGALGYEIWNEENSHPFWDPPSSAPPSPAGWTRLFCEAAKEIRAVEPGARVGVGGLSGYSSTRLPSKMRATSFVAGAFAAGLAACKPSFVAYHPYLLKDYCRPRDPSPERTQTIMELRALHAWLRSHGHGDLNIWNTEWGFPSHAFKVGKGSCAYDPAWHASRVIDEYRYLNTLPYVRLAVYFNLVDDNVDDMEGNPFSSIGWLDRGWARKPVFGAWKDAR